MNITPIIIIGNGWFSNKEKGYFSVVNVAVNDLNML
jgi:hypothetical protein